MSARSTLVSIAIHAAAIFLLLLASNQAAPTPRRVSSIALTPLPAPFLPHPMPDKALGGGGGMHQLLPATAGHLPKIAPRQFVPPTLDILNPHPKLAMEMTIEAPLDAALLDRPLANLSRNGEAFSVWEYADAQAGTKPGEAFRATIAENMWRARAAFVFWSQDYVASDDCYVFELPFLLWRLKYSNFKVFVIRVNATSVDDVPIAPPPYLGVQGVVDLQQIIDDRNPNLMPLGEPNARLLLAPLVQNDDEVNALRKVRVVGHQQQAAGVQVQPSHWRYPSAHAGHQVVHRGTPLGVAVSGQVTFWFVEQNADRLGRL